MGYLDIILRLLSAIGCKILTKYPAKIIVESRSYSFDCSAEGNGAKDALANSLPGAFESSANAVNNFSNVFIYDLGLDYYSRYAEQVNAVTAGQTLEAARKYLVPDQMVVIAVGDRAKIEPDLRKLSLGTIEVRDAQGRPLVAAR